MYQGVVVVVVVVMVVGRYVGCREWLDMGEGGKYCLLYTSDAADD
mgnify:CR=1 FL=1